MQLSAPSWLGGRFGIAQDGRVDLTSSMVLLQHVGLLFVCFPGSFSGGLIMVAALPMASYSQPIIGLALLQNLTTPHLAIITLGGIGLVWSGAITRGWADVAYGVQWRPWLFLLVVILTWTYTTYGYNLYFNQGHYWDRALLLLFAIAIWWRPAFFAALLRAPDRHHGAI